MQIHIFRNGLKQKSKLLLDVIARGSLMSTSAIYGTTIIERMTLSDHQWRCNKSLHENEELNSNNALLEQNNILT